MRTWIQMNSGLSRLALESPPFNPPNQRRRPQTLLNHTQINAPLCMISVVQVILLKEALLKFKVKVNT